MKWERTGAFELRGRLVRFWELLWYYLQMGFRLDFITAPVKKNNTKLVKGDTNTIVSPRNVPFNFNKKILVLDLDETLVHSTTKNVARPDLSIEVSIEGITCVFHILKRPYVDYFIDTVCEWFEVMIFTASLRTYANPVIDKLGRKHRVWRRLFRESCLNTGGSYVKDLATVHKNLGQIIIIDNSPVAYSLNKDWMGTNPKDEALLEILPFLNALRHVNDVRSILSLRITNKSD